MQQTSRHGHQMKRTLSCSVYLEYVIILANNTSYFQEMKWKHIVYKIKPSMELKQAWN